MSQQKKPMAVKIPMIMESIMTLEIVIEPNETAAQLSRRLGVYHPSALCKWPSRLRLLPDENVYDLVGRGESLYVISKEPHQTITGGRISSLAIKERTHP